MNQSKKSGLRWALTVVRYGLCAAAIVYLYNVVPWHDQVHIDGPKEPWVRVVERSDDGSLIIEREGKRETISADRIHYKHVEGVAVEDVKPGIRNVVVGLNLRGAMIAILIFAPVWLIQSARLVLMLSIQGVRLGYWNATKLTYAGNFFNFALPGTTGGDLIKAYYCTLYTHRKTEVVTTIFLDRVIGLMGLVVLASFSMLLTWDPERYGQVVKVLAIVVGILAVMAVLVLSRRLRHALRLPDLVRRLPLSDQLIRVGRATIAMRKYWMRVVLALALSVVLQTLVMISAAVMGRDALGMQGTLAQFFIYVSIGFLVAAIPISPPQAFGVMEYFYVIFFTAGGLNSASQAVAFALAVRMIQLFWALPGLLVPLFGAHLPSKTDLQILEAEVAAAATDTPPGPAGQFAADTSK